MTRPAIILAFMLIASLMAAFAQLPAFPQTIGDWYRSLYTRGGISCCSISDCAPHDYRTSSDHYEVWHNGQWLPVPSEAILPRYDNPTGRAVACVVGGRVVCFIKASEV